MKKKRFLFIIATMVAYFLTLGGAISASAQDLGNPIKFSIAGVDEEPIEPGYGKGPVLMPTVWQDGYLLDFQGTHDVYVLRLVDSSDTVVYSTVVPSYQTQLWLPTYLVGAYELQLYNGSQYYFYGEIEL